MTRLEGGIIWAEAFVVSSLDRLQTICWTLSELRTAIEAMRWMSWGFTLKLSKDLLRAFLNPLLKPTKSSEPTYQLILNSIPDVKSCEQYFVPHVNHNQDPQNETSSMNWIKCEGAHVSSAPKNGRIELGGTKRSRSIKDTRPQRQSCARSDTQLHLLEEKANAYVTI